MGNEIKLSNIGNILSNIGEKIITNQTLLKLIAYDSKDCLSLSDLSDNDIIKLVGKGESPINEQRIFKSLYNIKEMDNPCTELRFCVPRLKPNNIYLSDISVSFQVVVHWTLWELENNELRALLIMEELLKDLNSNDSMGTIGKLQLNSQINYYNWDKWFKGYELILSARTD